MKTDDRNLWTAEEDYFADSIKYTTNLGTLSPTSVGVVGPTIALTADGWTAWVSHTATPKTCAIYVGSTALAPATKEGATACQLVSRQQDVWCSGFSFTCVSPAFGGYICRTPRATAMEG